MNAALIRLASPRVTLAVLTAIAVSVLLNYVRWLDATWGLAAALSLFVLNLGASIAVNPVFRKQSALLAFHLALIAIALLLAASRMVYLKGHLELATGETFTGQLSEVEAGPWHHLRLNSAAFTNDGFDVEYDPGLLRGKTTNHVHWSDEDGGARIATIGDNRPLVLHGYRFYTSFNKGFAPAFLWTPKNGAPVHGTVHLPSYPMHETQQSIEWRLPNSATSIWTALHVTEPLLDPQTVSHFVLPRNYRLAVRAGNERVELRPGEHIDLPDGTLVFEELRTWMGYTAFYDWTNPWLLASCLIAALSLTVHYWRKFSAAPAPQGE